RRPRRRRSPGEPGSCADEASSVSWPAALSRRPGAARRTAACAVAQGNGSVACSFLKFSLYWSWQSLQAALTPLRAFLAAAAEPACAIDAQFGYAPGGTFEATRSKLLLRAAKSWPARGVPMFGFIHLPRMVVGSPARARPAARLRATVRERAARS